MPMVVPEPLPLLLLSLQRLLLQKLIPRLHVTAAHPPSPSVQRAAPHHIPAPESLRDPKGTRLKSSHLGISYAVFCLLNIMSLQRLRQQKLIHRLHVTAAHPPSPSVQRAAPHHIPAPESLRNPWEP